MLYCILYSSEMNELSESEINSIKAVSLFKNKKSSISGVLLSNGHEFLQVLEGEYEEVMQTFQRINADRRHTNVNILYQEDVENRSFAEWNMRYSDIDAKKFQQRTGFDSFRDFFKKVPPDRCLKMALLLFNEYTNTTS